MLDQMQVSSLITVKPVIVTPVLDHIHLGHMMITNDQQDFLEAIEEGIMSYCELHLAQQQMSAQDLLTMLVRILQEDHDPLSGEPVSYAERLGFIFGKIAGLLNPDLADPFYENLTYLEALSYKGKQDYQEGECPCDDRFVLGGCWYVTAAGKSPIQHSI